MNWILGGPSVKGLSFLDRNRVWSVHQKKKKKKNQLFTKIICRTLSGLVVVSRTKLRTCQKTLTYVEALWRVPLGEFVECCQRNLWYAFCQTLVRHKNDPYPIFKRTSDNLQMYISRILDGILGPPWSQCAASWLYPFIVLN